MQSENTITIQAAENDSYTWVSSETLQIIFPGIKISYDYVARDLPSEPLIERNVDEVEQLKTHPFFA